MKKSSMILVLLTLAGFVHVLSAQVLLSSIIAWLSVRFTPALPGALGFAGSLLSLTTFVASIFLASSRQPTRTCAALHTVLGLLTAALTLALLIPFFLLYAGEGACDQCSRRDESSSQCVDQCSDECCFPSRRQGLVTAIVVSAACVVGNNLGASFLGCLYFCLSSRSKKP